MTMRPDASAMSVLMQHPPIARLDLDPALPLVECSGSICFTDGRKAELWIRVGTSDARRYILAPAP